MYNLENADIKNNTLIIPTEDGSVICIPEEGATNDELALFKVWRELYPNGKPVPTSEPIILEEPVDEEKVAMAEAIIDLDSRLSQLEVRINA